MVIWNIGVLLDRLCEFLLQIKEKITPGVDERMAIVVDVHTDPNSKEALEVGIGSPFLIYVVTKIEDETKITKGGIFSHYEFKVPIEKRLDDETWQKRSASEEVTSLSEWTRSFIID